MKKIKKENLALKKEVISFLSDEKLKAIKGMGGDTNTNTLGFGCPTATFYGVCLSKGCPGTDNCGGTNLSHRVCNPLPNTDYCQYNTDMCAAYSEQCITETINKTITNDIIIERPGTDVAKPGGEQQQSFLYQDGCVTTIPPTGSL